LGTLAALAKCARNGHEEVRERTKIELLSRRLFVPLGGDCLGSWLWMEPERGMRGGCWAGIGLTQLAASQRSYFWIIGTRARNTIGCSKIRFYWHLSLLEIAGKQDGFGPAACQKSSNSRLIGDSSKVPTFQNSTARGGRPRRRIGVERRTGPLEPGLFAVGGWTRILSATEVRDLGYRDSTLSPNGSGCLVQVARTCSGRDVVFSRRKRRCIRSSYVERALKQEMQDPQGLGDTGAEAKTEHARDSRVRARARRFRRSPSLPPDA